MLEIVFKVFFPYFPPMLLKSFSTTNDQGRASLDRGFHLVSWDTSASLKSYVEQVVLVLLFLEPRFSYSATQKLKCFCLSGFRSIRMSLYFFLRMNIQNYQNYVFFVYIFFGSSRDLWAFMGCHRFLKKLPISSYDLSLRMSVGSMTSMKSTVRRRDGQRGVRCLKKVPQFRTISCIVMSQI